jgi:hypothetical protein
VRLGFANRTADLQAPVGYDKWSYGYRDKGGSKVHQSRRDDAWGGESYGKGDVVGFLIHLEPRAAIPLGADPKRKGENYIRFFKNGQPCGNVVEKAGKLSGGVAFDISPGVYYPAASCYSGGRVRANFGPSFRFPPPKSLAPEFRPVPKAEKAPLEADLLAKLHKQVSLKFTIAEKTKGRKKRQLNEEKTDFASTVALLGEIVAARVREKRLADWAGRQRRRAGGEPEKPEEPEEPEKPVKLSDAPANALQALG